jgi:DNA-binding transcriptional MerR regulator
VRTGVIQRVWTLIGVHEDLAYQGAFVSDSDDKAALLSFERILERCKARGLDVTERMLRFYATEGILPRPEGTDTELGYGPWVVTRLAVIDTMRNRFGRSLRDIRTLLRGEDDHGALLLEKLRAIDEEYLRPAIEGRSEASLSREEANRLVERFFAAISGPDAQPVIEVSVLDLAMHAAEGTPPQPAEVGAKPPTIEERVEFDPFMDAPDPPREETAAPGPEPRGGITAEAARAAEELFLGRFDETMARVCRLPHPLEEALYPANPRDRIHLKRTRSDEVIEVMKRHRVYDRDLLDALPLDEVSEYRVFTRSIFGRKDVRVVVAACCVSPLATMIVHRRAEAPAGPADLERAIEAVSPREGAFYYLGVLSTTGWTDEAERHLPQAPNVLACLLEAGEGTAWHLRYQPDERWSGLYRLFDPESEREKIERVKHRILSQPDLQLRGGHILVKRLREEFDVPRSVLAGAILEVVREDPDLTIEDVAGREIIKRRRL